MLGQRNAQSFLKRYFMLRSDNPVLALSEARRARREMVRIVDAGEDFYGTDLPLPDWPRIGQAQLDPILENAQGRLQKLGGKILKDMKLGWFLRSVLGSVWSWDLFGGAGKKIGRLLAAKVMHELIRRDQHEDFKELAPGRPFQLWQRAVLVALAEAGDRPVPVALAAHERAAGPAGGARARSRPADLVSAVENPGITAGHLRAFLDSAEMSGRIWRTPRRDDRVAYTLMALRPGDAWKHNVKAVTDRVRGVFGR
jgi:hypothetical protein